MSYATTLPSDSPWNSRPAAVLNNPLPVPSGNFIRFCHTILFGGRIHRRERAGTRHAGRPEKSDAFVERLEALRAARPTPGGEACKPELIIVPGM